MLKTHIYSNLDTAKFTEVDPRELSRMHVWWIDRPTCIRQNGQDVGWNFTRSNLELDMNLC